MVTAKIDAGDTMLSPAGYRRAGGRRAGAAHWWLRHASGAFHALRERVAGHRRFCQTVSLPAGSYVLGTGRGADEIRWRVVVSANGEVRTSPIREAA